ncbi:MAG: NAD-dependent epimerase/dehydratase family protein [Acidobacteria bacterium]|nr:NAD-dependent epimerase/dehydratase family protein [Acidobacteriota bacterium]
MKILVTGAAGFLGMHLTKAATSLGEVIAVERTGGGITGNCTVERADLSNPGEVRRLFERWHPDVVLHTAAHIPQSPNDDIYKFFDDNVRATVNIYHSALLTGVCRIVFSSSMSVYGRPQSLPVGEEHPAVPDTPYALSKIQAELTGRCYAESGLETTVLRYSGIFGAGQRSGAVPVFIGRCLQNAPMTLHAGGRSSSDFVWVQDVVQANLLALHYSQRHNFQVINIGSGVELTVSQLACMIRELCGSRSVIEAVEDRSPRDFRFAYDIGRARGQLGFVPTPMDAALKECIRQKREAQW